MNVQISVLDIDANLIYIAAARAIVDGHQLSSFAIGADEAIFIASNNFSTVYNPFVTSQDVGFNSGNLLLGLFVSFVMLLVLVVVLLMIMMIFHDDNGLMFCCWQWRRRS